MFANLIDDFDDDDTEWEKSQRNVLILELSIDWIVVMRSLQENFFLIFTSLNT